jgi:hypothetical protein
MIGHAILGMRPDADVLAFPVADGSATTRATVAARVVC